MKNTKEFNPFTEQEIKALVQSLPWDGCTGLVGGRLLATIQDLQERIKVKDKSLLVSLKISSQLAKLLTSTDLQLDPDMYNYAKGM
jgi:hypothetical protein